MKVRYKNSKELLTVLLPIGVKSPRESLSKIEFGKSNPVLDLKDADAKALVELDPGNFELLPEPKKAKGE